METLPLTSWATSGIKLRSRASGRGGHTPKNRLLLPGQQVVDFSLQSLSTAAVASSQSAIAAQ
ncbi:MAG: hypothetical protein WBA57_24820 [Elainellaceae cyanobacterium]